MTYGQLTPAQIDKLVSHPKFDEFIAVLQKRYDEAVRSLLSQ